MNANELRIGNLYKGDCTSQKYWKVTAQEILDFYDDPLDDYFQPIEITKDWLLKLGFKKTDNQYMDNYIIKIDNSTYNSVGYDEEENEWYYNNDYSDASCYFVTYIKYVHELQNLYFAINKHELKHEI